MVEQLNESEITSTGIEKIIPTVSPSGVGEVVNTIIFLRRKAEIPQEELLSRGTPVSDSEYSSIHQSGLRAQMITSALDSILPLPDNQSWHDVITQQDEMLSTWSKNDIME